MAETLKTTSSDSWSGGQTVALVVVCLLVGIAGGWLFRKSIASHAAPEAVSAPAPPIATSQPPANFGMGSGVPSEQQLKEAAETQATPMLEKLQSDPNNAGLLAELGNIYYDAKLYPKAIEYYERSLKMQPANTSVRTDLGTAYWYIGNADSAIAQFNKSLTYDPNKADTLFNLGIVKWQGKQDGPGAIAAWQKLLAANPAYPNRNGVEQLIAQAQQR